MIAILTVLAAITGIGVWLTERVDRPARRLEREALGAHRA